MSIETNSLSLAKITKPYLPRIFHRERLYRLLDQKREYPCTWIKGPAGSGKTTLVSGYITNRRLPCLWYQIDQGDHDLATFFHYLGLAATRISTESFDALRQFTTEYAMDIPVFALRYFEDVYRLLQADTVLILDNYQEVQYDSPLHEVIRHAVSAMPRGLNYFILSRAAPHAAFSRLKANRLMTGIAWDQLRLTRKETGAIARLQKGKALPKETVTNLHVATEGWVAGLILMLSGAGTDKNEMQRSYKHRPKEIFDYLAQEVFHGIDSDTRDLLFKTALFPNMTCRMAESLTGQRQVDRILAGLYRNHLFIEKHSPGQTSYQYHPLFREFLLTRFAESYSEEDRRRLRCEAARLLEEDGQAEAAISLLHDSEYWKEALPFIHRHAPSFLSQGRTQPLLRWLEQLPGEWLNENPWLNYWRGACHLPFDPITSRSCFEKGFELFLAQGDREGLLWTWSAIVQSVFYAFEGFPILDRWIEVLEGLMQEDSSFPSGQIEARVVFGMFSALTFRQPHHPRMRHWAERAVRLADATHDVRGKAYAYTQLIFYHMMMGCHGKGLAVLEAAERLREAARTDPLVHIDVLAVKACYHQNMQNHEKCLQTIREGLEFSAQSGVRILDAMFLGWGAWSALAADDLETAADLIERLGTSQSHLRPHESSFYHFLRSQEAVSRQEFQKASQHADLALEILESLGIPINICIVHLSKAQALHGLHRTVEAKRHAAAALETARQMGSSMLQFSALLLRAKIAIDRGDEESAQQVLRNAMLLGRENSYCTVMVGSSSDMITICDKALEAGIEVDYVRSLIRRRRFTPKEPEVTSGRWPWPIKIMTLGGFELFIHGKPFSSVGRGPQKTLSLLKLLIALGEKGVSETRIQDALWPDMEGDFAHNIFSTTLYRLRKILGSPKAITLTQGVVSLDAEQCWVDIRSFSKMLELANRRWGMGHDGARNAVDMLGRAMAIYKGAFLPDDDNHWLIPVRERLASDFRQCVKRLGRYYEKMGEVERTIRCYAEGLRVDPLDEDFYRRLMVCYCRAGRHAEAKVTFIRCREALSKMLGVEPSKETEALYRESVQRTSL